MRAVQRGMLKFCGLHALFAFCTGFGKGALKETWRGAQNGYGTLCSGGSDAKGDGKRSVKEGGSAAKKCGMSGNAETHEIGVPKKGADKIKRDGEREWARGESINFHGKITI